MTFDWLKEIIGDGYTDETDKKVSEELGKRFVAANKHSAVNEAKNALETTVAERDKQLEALKKVDAAALQAEITKLQGENKTAAEKHAADLAAVKLDAALDAAILSAKGKNTTAIKALLKKEGLKLKDDGTVEGLDLAAVQSSDAYLFEQTTTTQEGAGAGDGAGGTPAAGGSEPPEDFAAYRTWREKQ